jgi:hypothetical protein
MAVTMVMEWAGVTPEQYEETRRRVDWEGNVPAGAIFHVARFSGDTIHVLDIWESPEDFQRFADERLMPVVSTLGVETEPKVSFQQVHAIFNPGVDRAGTAVSA